MITVEQAIKDDRTRKAVEGSNEDAKKSIRKKVLIGVAVVGGAYLGYRLLKMRKGNAAVQPINQ